MRYAILFSIILLFLFVSCGKDKFSTTPSLKFKSVNTSLLHRQEVVRFTLSFTDAEGDLTDSIYVQELVPNCQASNDRHESFLLPEFPSSKNQQGDIIVTFQYEIFPPQCSPKNDTATFRFVLKDKAQHSSDTISSPPVIIVYN